MVNVMTMDAVHDMFAEKRRRAFGMFCDFEEKANKALEIGDHAMENLYRKFAKQWERHYEKLAETLNEIYKVECAFKKEDWV